MFCGNCGQQLKDDAKFCHGCGNPVVQDEVAKQEIMDDGVVTGIGAGADAMVSGAGVGGGNVRTKRVKKQQKKAPLWIPIAIGGVVLVVLLGILIGSLLGGDSAKLVKAVTKSAKAYTTAYEKLGMPDLSYIAEKKAYSAEMAVTIDEMDGSTDMAGFGARMDMDVSLDKRDIGVSVTPFFGAADLLTANMRISNEKVYVGVPELTGTTNYMINTQTLGKDLNNLGADMEELEEFGFNLFDIMEQVEKIAQDNEKVNAELEKAFSEFAKTIEVEKTGSEEIDVNGNDLKCNVYEVVITEDAMADLVDAIEDAYKDMDSTDAYIGILESMGLPEYAIEEMEYELEYAYDDTDEMFEELRYALEFLGDVELQVCVNDGYVVAVIYEERIDGSKVEIALNLGGGKNYVDDLSLTIDADGTEVRMVSTGNHSLSDGKFTDKTTVKVSEGSYNYTALTMKTNYEPKAKKDNFKWQFDTDSAGVKISGQVNTTGDSITMALDEVTLTEYGYNLMTYSMEYSIGKYQASSISTKNAVELGKLTEDQLMAEMEKIEENGMEWAEKLMEQFPELMYYLY